MSIPAPEPGLVINYGYLWHYEHQAGQEEGRKDRPSVIVLCQQADEDGAIIVTVLPITHREPDDPNWGVEIPVAIRRHLGLDEAPGWIIVSEGNEFQWPGYDLGQRSDGSFVFGFLPPRFFKRVLAAFIALHRTAKAKRTRRN